MQRKHPPRRKVGFSYEFSNGERHSPEVQSPAHSCETVARRSFGLSPFFPYFLAHTRTHISSVEYPTTLALVESLKIECKLYGETRVERKYALTVNKRKRQRENEKGQIIKRLFKPRRSLMPFHLPRLTTLNRSSIHRGGSGVEEIFPSDEIHNWFISARETKACWKTIFGIIELPYTFFFPLPFFSRRFFIAIFPFLFVLFFFFFILYFSFAPLRGKVSSARVQRAFFRGN